jgi:hypothetical protein
MRQICCTILFLLSLKQKPNHSIPLQKSDEYVMNLLEKKPTLNIKFPNPNYIKTKA